MLGDAVINSRCPFSASKIHLKIASSKRVVEDVEGGGEG
jgi:hypothetical protein